MAQPPQVYPDTKIITLLESNSESGDNANGTFNVNLDQQVILKEGDTIELSKVFVDTTPSEETFITITPEESEITIKHGMYLTDILPNDATAADPPVKSKPIWGKWSVPTAKRPNATRYILQNEHPDFNDTFLDWEQANNSTIAPVGTLQFKTELTALVPEDNNGFEYTVTALLPSPPPQPANPLTPDLLLDTKYYMGGHCRLIATASTSPYIGPFEFYYYHRDYVPPGGVFGDNDHTAVISRWTTGATPPVILGWKIKGNPNTTETNEANKWLYKSDFEGYNYFDAGGNPHMIEITEVAMAINNEWTPVLDALGKLDRDFPIYPGYTIEWYDPRTQETHQYNKRFDASQYYPIISTTNPPVIIGGGVDELTKVLPKDSRIPYDKRQDAPLNLPQDAKKGWGRNNGWDFYKVSQFDDPYAQSSLVTLPKMVVSVDHMPQIQFYFFNQKTKQGLPSGFVNKEAYDWYDPKTQIMTMNSSQVLGQNPIINSATGGRTFKPREYTTKFTIPPGNYSNGDLAQILTDKINQNTSPVEGLSNNPYAEQPVLNAAGYSSSYFLQTTYELMEQADGYSQSQGLPTNLTRYPNDYAYSQVTIPPRTLADGTVLGQINATVATNPGVQPYWLSEDTTQLFQFNANYVQPLGSIDNQLARNVGASQVSILFDETEQAFTIAQAHTNIVAGVVGTPITPAIQFVQVEPENSKSFFGNQVACDTYSGIFFTDLQPRSLWFQKMGLSINLLTTTAGNFTNKRDFSTDPESSFNGLATQQDLASVLCHPTFLTKGVNVTGLFNGVDNLIVKKPYGGPALPGSDPSANFAVQPRVYSEAVETDTLVSIIGDSQVNAVEDDPYFQLEISGINSQNIVGQPTKNNLVQGIVGKFYSNGNFTQDEDSGYAYVHRGEPLVIRSLAVRILDSLGNPEEGLGPSSAVVLKISTDK